ncbi:MAG TPA: hypothetical protein VFW19_10675 [Allosphingosinicella sp.]|nr:hypothetical protein [Allosphingosinicella sp.]
MEGAEQVKAAKPYMQFYPQDWRADEKLRLCSLAARGLWIEILALMHRSERYGHLLISGHVPTDVQLAVQVGAPPQEVSAMLAELQSAGVFSRAASGAIYSRRMTRDEKKALIARQNGKSGGNPSLRKTKEKPASDKGQDKGEVKPQRPETRDQSRREDKPLSGDGLPDWLPRDEWAGFKAMRTRIKKPLTHRAEQMALAELERLREGGQNPAAVLKQSEFHCWKGLFPVKSSEAPASPGVDLFERKYANAPPRTIEVRQ